MKKMIIGISLGIVSMTAMANPNGVSYCFVNQQCAYNITNHTSRTFVIEDVMPNAKYTCKFHAGHLNKLSLSNMQGSPAGQVILHSNDPNDLDDPLTINATLLKSGIGSASFNVYNSYWLAVKQNVSFTCTTS